MEFTHPWYFVLLLVAPFLGLWMRGSLAEMTAMQRRIALACRTLLLSLLVFALVGISLRLPSSDVSVLFLVDHSASISPEAQKQAHEFVAASLAARRPGDDAGIIGFARHASVWQPPSINPPPPGIWPSETDRNATETSNALVFASAVFPSDKTKRIVLLSDGNDTGENGLATAADLSGNGIEVFAVPLDNPQKPEVLVEKIEMPARLKSGEPFDAAVKIRANLATSAVVKFYKNGFLSGTKTLELKKGTQDIVFSALKADQGQSVVCEAEVIPGKDTVLENNRMQATATVQGQPLVLVVDNDASKIQPFVDALRQGDIKTEVRTARGLPTTLADLQQFDLLILSDVPALSISREQMELYRMWVRDFGGGFIMLGGENSYGVGGYYRTPIEQMLPVRMEHEDRVDTPSVALLVILDRSGSMAVQVQGQTKISLADQGAALALQVLQPKDLFGVTAVDTQVHNIVPLGHPDNKPALEQKIMSITSSGGGIYVYTSLLDAFQQMRDVNARIKHVILFSDAADAEEKSAGDAGSKNGASSFDIVTAMLAEKISTSVVGLGNENDKDVDFLKELASRGNGRFYLTNDAFNLPQIFATETIKVAQSSLVEEPFAVVRGMPSPVTDGIDWKQAPLLLGCNATKPKPTADLLLATERGEPLLATWRYGLGHTAAFTSDAKSRWASEWIPWAGYGKFWAQMVRGMMRRSEQTSLQVTASETGDTLALKIDAVSPEGNFMNDLPLSIRTLAVNGEAKSIQPQQEAPGGYTATLSLPEKGTSLFSISSPELPGGEYILSHTRGYPKEFLSTETNLPWLRQLAENGHGKFNPAPRDVFAPSEKSAVRMRDLTEYFLMLALLLFPVDIWIRRRSWAS